MPVRSASHEALPHGLSLGSPNDSHEQQAGRVAERALNGTDNAAARTEQKVDLSGVRVHTGPGAVESARAVDALAYTVGNHVVWGAEQRSLESGPGSQVLAHELTHVVQQSRVDGAPRGVVQRVGLFQSIARFFGGGTFSDVELKAYIEGLRGTGKIEDNFDSDNKARAVVSKGLYQKEDVGIRTLLVQEMLTGHVSSADEQGILTILKNATPDDRERIVGKIGAEALVKAFSGDARDQLYIILGGVTKHKKDPVDTDWAVSYTADGGGASRPQRIAVVVDQLQAQPNSTNTPLDVVTSGKSVVNNNPSGAPMPIPGTVPHPRDTGGVGYMGFHVAVQRPDLSAAEVPGFPIQAAYPAVGIDRHHVTAKVDLHLGSEKVGERQVQKQSETEEAKATEQTQKQTSSVQVSTGQKQTAGQRRAVSGEKATSDEHQKSSGKETTDTTSRTITLTLGAKLTPEFSAKLAAKTGIQVDGGLLAAILAVAEPEGALLAKELGSALSSIKFNLEGSVEFGFKVTLELSAQLGISWTNSHSTTVKKGTIDSHKEEQRLKGEVDVTAGAEQSSGTVVSSGQESSTTQKKSQAERQRTSTTDTTAVNKLTVDKAGVTFDVR